MWPPNQSQLVRQFRSGTVLGFDFGTKRIGVAIGEIGIGMAHPLETVVGEKNVQRFNIIAELIRTWEPVMLVVGLPTHIDGTEHELTRLSRRFAGRLEGRFKISVWLIDERYTSLVASEMLRELGIKGRKQKNKLDQIAAQQILQSFFDEYQKVTTA